MKAGLIAEDVIAGVLRGLELKFDRQVILGLSIYGTRLHADFVIRNLADFPQGLALESKWQTSNGTSDEKFPYVVENIRRAYPIPAIVLVCGGGCRPGARDWLRSRCDGQQLVAVYSLEEFIAWAMAAADKSKALLV
jgi:hypothetical protein